MVGKLILNSKYLIFQIYEPRYSGVLQTGRLAATGRVLSIPLQSIIETEVESGVRARRSRPNWKDKDDFEKKSSGERVINAHPGILDNRENFSRVVLTTETENGVEMAAFEVQNPYVLQQSLKKQISKSPG